MSFLSLPLGLLIAFHVEKASTLIDWIKFHLNCKKSRLKCRLEVTGRFLRFRCQLNLNTWIHREGFEFIIRPIVKVYTKEFKSGHIVQELLSVSKLVIKIMNTPNTWCIGIGHIKTLPNLVEWLSRVVCLESKNYLRLKSKRASMSPFMHKNQMNEHDANKNPIIVLA